ncbi:pyrroline-5-carboxylate reductase [Magnetovibrio sp.]|uniref:pyrroline-5-carboxylate reductase n=1 Tax=Magnetovibrio sp. TaxID=2024836 RepID=UPI002F9356ED
MPTLLLIGCGKMGGAMLEGWLDQGIAATDITVIEPSAELAATLAGKYGVNAVSGAHALAEDYAPDVAVLAVKPQVMDQVLPPYKNLVAHATVFLSIAAGRTIASFETILGTNAAVVRAMPNTPASVGRGITVGCPNANVTDTQKELCDRLLTSVGQVEWVDDEKHMDAVTAVSGSGPAYIFLLAEAMGHAGRMSGLPPELSDKLARATVAGAGELLHQSPESAATLRENVTSPGGTTAAALEVLMGPHGLKELMEKAIDAATRRSKELAS